MRGKVLNTVFVILAFFAGIAGYLVKKSEEQKGGNV